jgi:signal transduction histidine kinase
MSPSESELRALILAPTHRDADVTLRLLREAQISVRACENETVLLAEMTVGAGVVIITDDVSRRLPALHVLHSALDSQPPWSELPVIALAFPGKNSGRIETLRALPGVVLLERPVYARTFVSAVQAALRARGRQYQMRSQLEQIRATNADLEEATHAKDEFLATLSHELRNPLSALTAAVRVLDRAEDKPAMAALAREIVGRQTEQMARLLDDLLDVARITRRRLEIRKTHTEVTEVIKAAIETAQPLIKAKSHALEVVLPREPIYLEADPVRLAQVVTNLLTNAAKYTERGGAIHLYAAREGSDLIVRVRDNGIGIPQESLDAIFRMFSQLRPAIERSEGGLGIGLALTKGLVELHGGSVCAYSDGPGRGSEFVIVIPIEDSGAETSNLKAAATVAASTTQHILIADDNPDSLDALARLLELDGHVVREARNGVEALALFDRYDPQVVLLDIGMPGMNGYEVARRIRHARPQFSGKLIALTGWGQARDRELAKEAGFDHHLTKPINVESLQTLLRG